MSMTTLVCSCGMTLKAAGARPGRVGKCPRCGSLLRVPEDFTTTPTDPPEATISRPSFHASPTLESPSRRGVKRLAIPADHGPLKAPKRLEKRFRESLAYPLWSWSSVAILIFLPPLLAIVSSPLTFLLGIFSGGTPFSIASLILLIPTTLGCAAIGGYTLAFMSHVLTSSAFGEPLPPRAPNLQDGSIFRVLGRWFWAFLMGFAIGFVPAVAYWINCGEIDWVDRLMLLNLTALGAAYAQMALLATLLHDDPFAANPITVLPAIIRVGWDYVGISLLGAGFILGMGGLHALIQMVNNSLLSVIFIWLYWVIFLYTAMIVLRRQGLFCHRHKVVLAWFRDRPTWGR